MGVGPRMSALYVPVGVSAGALVPLRTCQKMPLRLV